MSWSCPIHGSAKWVKPGVSKKTGKPYAGFFVCAEQGCEERPPKEGPPQRPQTRAVATPAKIVQLLDKSIEGKCRSLAICAWIQAGLPLEKFWEVEKDVLAYMMVGKTPFDEQWEPIGDGAPFPEA